MQSAADMVYAQAAIDGQLGSANNTTVTSAGNVITDFGYPDENLAGILAAIRLSGDAAPVQAGTAAQNATHDWVYDVASGAMFVGPGDSAQDSNLSNDGANSCWVSYTPATAQGGIYVINYDTRGC